MYFLHRLTLTDTSPEAVQALLSVMLADSPAVRKLIKNAPAAFYGETEGDIDITFEQWLYELADEPESLPLTTWNPTIELGWKAV